MELYPSLILMEKFPVLSTYIVLSFLSTFATDEKSDSSSLSLLVGEYLVPFQSLLIFLSQYIVNSCRMRAVHPEPGINYRRHITAVNPL